MDPAILNYLQSQQQPNQMSNMEQASQQQAPYNPFDTGIRAAINSARESLGMTQKQQDKALRSSMLSFANNIAQQPREKGFWNNVGSVGRALEPAISTYDQEENTALNENNALGNQILKYQGAEQDRQAKAEEQEFWRSHVQEQLGETRRNNNLLDNFRSQKIVDNQPPVSPLGSDFIPIKSKSERLMFTKDKKASGEILQELSSIKEDYDKFKNLSKNDVINPMTPYGIGKVANAGKDFLGYFTDNKNLREETSKRKALDAKLGKFAVELERKIKGGVLSEGMVKRFENKGLLPALTDAPDVFEEKLNNLTKEMLERYKASDASLRHGVHISPLDLEQLEQLEKGNRQESTNLMTPSQERGNQEPVIMKDPETGEEGSVPIDRIQEALDDGLILVNE